MARTIVIFSTKGGVGKTLIAVNLAVSLAKDQKKKVCLLDLDLGGLSDMSRMLGLKPQTAMVDLIDFMKKNPGSTEFKKENFLTSAASFGVDFMSGVLRPQQAGYFDAEKIPDVFRLLEKDYDYIIIDSGKSFNDVFVTSLNQANLILLAVTPDVLSVYQIKWVTDTLQLLHFPLSMVKLVLNRAESLSSISWQEIKNVLPAEIICQISSEGKLVLESVNRGIPVVIESPRSKTAQTIKKFALDIATKSDLFLERYQVDSASLKELAVDSPQAFWQGQGLAESLPEVQPAADEIKKINSLRQRIHNRLIQELDLKKLDLDTFKDPKKMKELREKAGIMIMDLLTQETGSFISSPEARKLLVKEILDGALGLGALEDFLPDPEITDIMVNNKDEIYIERCGKIELSNKKFVSNEQVRTVIERIIAPIGRRIDESVPMVDARLSDGSRVNAIIPPLSLTGPTLTIRKFRKEKLRADDLVRFNSLNQPMADFIKACVLARKNIIVSGGTGSGKTTVLNVLSEFIPEGERIITIEDAAELKLQQRHWIRLESRPPNIEGKGAIVIRDLFRNTLRMRPDRIIIGECRGIEILDMLQAMNTGHDGSMTTIHANSTRDVLTRMDTMILMSGIEMPVRAIREMIASAVNLVIHTGRLSDGTRKILQVTELVGMRDDMYIDTQDIFLFKQSGLGADGNVLGDFRATGYIPSFIEEMKTRGIFLPEDTFKS